MNIFDQLQDILSGKTDKISENEEFEKEFVPYMVQRWLSFYSPQVAVLVNRTSNILWKGLDDKRTWYKLFTGVTPRTRFRSIKYIKKKKESSAVKTDNEIVEYLAERFELSKKEIKEYIASGNLDIKQLKKQLEDN